MFAVYGFERVPSWKAVPVASRTVIVPSPVVGLNPFAVLFLYMLDTAYHNRSPEASRRSEIPNVRQGNRPSLEVWEVLPDAFPQLVSAKPSSLRSGQGNVPTAEFVGWMSRPAA